MGIPDGAHTHGHGGGFDPIPILIVRGAVAVAGPVMAAVAELVHVLLVIAVVVFGVGVAGLVALLVW